MKFYNGIREKKVKIFSSRDDLKSNEYETDEACKIALVQRGLKLWKTSNPVASALILDNYIQYQWI